MRVFYTCLGFLLAGISAADTNIKDLLNQEIESTETDDVEIKWLTEINRLVIKDTIIDINLYQIDEVEDCFIKSPGGDILNFNDVTNEKDIKIHRPSEFVSCRCTVGPITEELLGKWTIVGSYEKDGINYIRKQNVNLQWINPKNPDQTWSEKYEDVIKYVVNFGFSISPVIFTYDSVLNCHIITPNAEEITLLNDSKYPNITLLDSTSWDCSVKIGPVSKSTLGDWMIVAESKDIVVKRPLHLYLYDEDNPYDQAYNKTYLGPHNNIVHLGNTITVKVTTSRVTDTIDECYVQRPINGDIQILEKGFNFDGVKFEELETSDGCQISIGPIVREMLGDWRLIGKFNGRGLFHEIIQLFRIIEEDPSNPLVDPNRKIVLLDEVRIQTDLNTTHKFTIPSDWISPNLTDTCHIITPNGLQYKFLKTFNVTGVEVIETNSKISCGISIKVISEDQLGDWTLISRETRSSELIERRLPIRILVEEFVKTSPTEEVVISRGIDFYIRLEEPTDLYSTCDLIPPNGIRNYELDHRFVDRCGFVVRNVVEEDSGIWEIKYGAKIVYRAQLNMNVLAPPDPIINSLRLERFRPVNMTIGPENAVFCRIIDPLNRNVFSDFGMCKIVVQNVRRDHGGTWRLFISLPGSMVPIQHYLAVSVVNPAPPPVVTSMTSLINESSQAIIVSCSATLPSKITSCKFRQPNGEFLTPTPGLGEGRYSFHGEGTRFYLNQYQADCGIRINSLSYNDLGTWRCAIETLEQTYFGFINVKQINDVMMDEEKIYNIRAPDRMSITEGDSTQMLCQIDAPIAYCYFRSENGAVINLSPGRPSENYEYFGDGFDAGDCGLVIRKTSPRDDGEWTCNLGPRDITRKELQHRININVESLITLEQYLLFDFSMELVGFVREELEYCRFVRSDGLGFTLNNLPPGYTLLRGDYFGLCGFSVQSPSAADRDSWTVAFKIRGHLHEISAQTASVNNSNIGVPMYVLIILYVFIIFLCILIVSSMLTFLLPRKNRERTFARIITIRNSIRNSLRKKPAELNTPIVHSFACDNNSAPSA